LKAVEKWEVGGKRMREVMEEAEWTKVNRIHSGVTLGNPSEHQLKY
jgi:hypothetical protein